MRFARVLAATAGVLAIGAGGALLLSPKVSGQDREVVVSQDDGLRVFNLGGSRLGISIRDVDKADATREKLGDQAGAVVEEVRSDGAAAKAGLKSGDVVISFDGERVRSARQLERLVDETPPGRTVKVAVQRGGSRVDLDVTPESAAGTLSFRGAGPLWQAEREVERSLEDLGPEVERDIRRHVPAFKFDLDRGDLFAKMKTRGRLGVSVQDMPEQLAGYFGVKSGVLVADVDAESPAAKAGIKAGDVITAVNGQTVDGPEDLRREVGKVEEGKAADLSVTRDKKALSLKVEVESPARKIERRVRRTV